MATRYGSASSVKTRTGVAPEDLGLDSEEDLDVFLNELLDEITDLFDRRMKKSYLAEASTPRGLDGIANDAAADSLRTMVATRQTPVVRIDDFAVRTIQTRVFSPDILSRLKIYATGGGAATLELGSDSLAGLPTTFTLADLDAETP